MRKQQLIQSAVNVHQGGYSVHVDFVDLVVVDSIQNGDVVYHVGSMMNIEAPVLDFPAHIADLAIQVDSVHFHGAVAVAVAVEVDIADAADGGNVVAENKIVDFVVVVAEVGFVAHYAEVVLDLVVAVEIDAVAVAGIAVTFDGDLSSAAVDKEFALHWAVSMMPMWRD